MNVVAYVTKPDLGGGSIVLTSDGYRIEGEEGVEFGGLTWRRNMVTSPFVHGGFPVTQVKENSTLMLTIQVRGTSQADLGDKIAALVAAFSQFEYEVSITFDDEEWAYLCWAADIVVGAQDERMAQWNIPVKLSIPRSPTPQANGGI